MTDVVVTGIGAVSALGVGVDALWAGLCAGVTGCRAPARVAAPEGAVVAEVPPLDARAFVRSPVGRRIDPTSLLAVVAARLALADAGMEAGAVAGPRTGLALGSSFGNVTETEGFVERLLARGTGNPLVFPNLVLNAPLGYVSIELGITGPSAMLTEVEASGEAAVAWAARQVATGACDVALAGGADELTGMLCTLRAETGTLGAEPPRPLDRGARGACPGEGGAVLLLERAGAARARGARVYACLRDVPGLAFPAPVHRWPRDPAPLAAALAPHVADADLLLAAATGTPALDAFEAAVLARAVGGRRVAVTAPRGALGEFGAAGALAVAAAALAVHHGLVPPTAGCRLPAREDLDVVVDLARRTPVRVAVVHGVARGGSCRPIRLEAP